MSTRLPDMTLRERAAQLVFARIGSNMHPAVRVEEDEERILALLDRCPLGGVILFNGDLATTPELLGRLQRRCRVPLLVASDIERGLGQQVRGATVFPHAMAFAHLGEKGPLLLRKAAHVTAREALACGIHIAFAPVADVNRELDNPIIATRAFGTEPEGVARLVQTYIGGCREEGLLTTAKHFPGHGNTREDSHETAPSVGSSRHEMERTDLVPFKAAIEAGVELVMSAHVRYPALDPEGTPATLSRPILNDLLRNELGFRGAVISDSMLMGAVRGAGSAEAVAEQAAALFRAGVDILLDPLDPEIIVDGLVHAVESGLLEEARIDDAASRVLAMKERLAERHGKDVFAKPPPCHIGSPEHRRLAQRIALGAVQVEESPESPLPLDPVRVTENGLLAVLVKPFRSRLDPPEAPLGDAVREAFPGAAYAEVGPETNEEEFDALLEHAGRAGAVVVALVVKPAAWQKFGLLDAQERFVRKLLERRQVVLASLGSPFILDRYPTAAARLCTFSDVTDAQQALVAVLAGVHALRAPH